MNLEGNLPAIPLWGFELLHPGLKRCSGWFRTRGTPRHAASSADIPGFQRIYRAKAKAFASTGKAVPYRQQSMNFQRENWASSTLHDGPCRNGGARICCPRPMVSMTIMAAPQSGHPKVG